MKAVEARIKAQVANEKDSNYRYAIKRVNEEAQKGHFFAWLYEPIKEEAKKILVGDGFEFSEESNFRNEYLIKISW